MYSFSIYTWFVENSICNVILPYVYIVVLCVVLETMPRTREYDGFGSVRERCRGSVRKRKS